MSIPALLIGLTLLILIGALVVRPLLDQSQYNAEPDIVLQSLLTDRDNILTLILDLEDDYATGKITENFFTQRRQTLVLRGARTLQQLDEHSAESVTELDALIEKQVAELRVRHDA